MKYPVYILIAFWGTSLALFAGFDSVVIEPEGSGNVHIALPGLLPDATEDFVYYDAVANDGYEFVKWTGHHMGEDEGSTNPYYEHRWTIGDIETSEHKTLTAHFRLINPAPFYTVVQNEGGNIVYLGEWITEHLFRETYTVEAEVGYVFLFWNLYPEGRAYSNQWVFEYDPSQPVTLDLKFLSAQFSALEVNANSFTLDYPTWLSVVEELEQLKQQLSESGDQVQAASEMSQLTEDEILDLRPGCVRASVQGNLLHLEMNLQTTENFEGDTWSNMVDESGDAMKATVEIPIEGGKRFYRFGN